MRMSAPYLARPVTLSKPSWRIGRVPTTLSAREGAEPRSAVPDIGTFALSTPPRGPSLATMIPRTWLTRGIGRTLGRGGPG